MNILLIAFLVVVFLIVVILAFGITTWIKAKKVNRYETPYCETKEKEDQKDDTKGE